MTSFLCDLEPSGYVFPMLYAELFVDTSSKWLWVVLCLFVAGFFVCAHLQIFKIFKNANYYFLIQKKKKVPYVPSIMYLIQDT